MERYCIEDGKYRYRLDLVSGIPNGKVSTVIMCNPSKADTNIDDATTKALSRWMEKNNYSTLRIVNLYAYRATKPADLLNLQNTIAIGSENDRHVIEAMQDVDHVILAWGNPKGRSKSDFLKRTIDVMNIVSKSCTNLCCVTPPTKLGYPRHPLYWHTFADQSIRTWSMPKLKPSELLRLKMD